MKSSEISLGTCAFDPRTGRLKDRGGSERELRHQARRVLQLLAETPGETVPKAAFFDTVWEGAHVSEDSLVQCIAEIRQALQDDAKTIVETVPRKGYRLIPAQSAPPGRTTRWRPALVAAVLACALAAVFLLSRPSDPPSRVIAVLPFQDDSAEADSGKLGDLVSAEVLANLARYPELTVIARNSSFRFRDDDRDISQIAEQLGADFILEGSQHVEGNRIRVTAQLIDAGNTNLVWSDQMDAEVSDLLQVSSQISSRIANSVEAFVAEAQVQVGDPQAVDALLMSLEARRLLQSRLSKENVAGAIAVGQDAVRLYPDQPWGHVSIAFALRTKLRFGWSEAPEEELEQAIGHAETAVRLAPENYVAHFALGRVRMHQGNQISAISAFESALHLNPSSANALNALAQSYFYLGQNDRALEALAQSARIDPLPGFVHPWMSAWVLWQDQRCDEAFESFSRITSPPPPALKLLAVIQVCRGETEEASDALARFLASEPEWTQSREKELHTGRWIAEGALSRWIDDLTVAGLPG